ncbi:MAG: rod shape-determining protein RodA [Sedimentisphaerales bacterium]|nr:rod shape-determining protein RodA [Sedimentisphaerales bacterium]
MIQRIWQGRLGGLRLVLILAVAALVGLGLLTIHTSGSGRGQVGSSLFVRKQIVWIALGILVFMAVNCVPYRLLGRYSYPLFGLSLILLVVVLAGKYLQLIGLVPSIRGATRWIRLIPIESDSSLVNAARIQPSELAKLTYILALAWYLRHRENYRSLTGLLGPFALTFLPMVLILLEPDLGTVLLFLPILFAVLFSAGARVRHLLTIILAALAICPIFYLLPGFMKGYQRERIEVLWKQNTDDPYWLNGPGYQLHQSKICIGSGGVTGQGWQLSRFVQYRHPPDQHNDFIFAMIAHQWGFLGALLVLGCYFLVLLGAMEIASSQPDPFGRLIAVGIAALLAAQMFINIGMTMGLMPVTGMNLPFVSYGGSSLLVNFFALGLLINVGRHRAYRITKKAFEFDGD